MNFNPVILFFAREASEEVKLKSLGLDSNTEIQLWSAIRKRILKITSQIGYDLIISTEKNQVGETFGDRISNDITKAFNSYEQVIVVGGDCPEISMKDIEDTISHLEKGDRVLGPDQHGGTWLIGLQKKYWDPEKFINISWHNNTVFQELHHYFSFKGKVVVLGTKLDLNQTDDLQFLLQTTRFQWIRQIIDSSTSSNLFHYKYYHSSITYDLLELRRGPPY